MCTLPHTPFWLVQGFLTIKERKATSKMWMDTYMKEGSYEVVKTLVDGAHFGENGCMANRPRVASVVATHHSELLKLERQDLMKIFRNYPKYVEDLGITV